jgi:hypothetical protein
MPTLREVQGEFAGGLLTRDTGRAAPFVVDDGAIAPAERLGIYRNTFVGTLIQALRNTYPAVERLVGAEFFEGAATIFVGRQPPVSAYLNDYGGEFGEFLAGFAPAAHLAYLPHVARLEWALSAVANAPDVPALDPATLGQLSEAEQGLVRFEPHPAVRLVRLAYDADVIRQAVVRRDEESFKGFAPDPQPFAVIVQRVALEPMMRRMSDAEAATTEALFAGRALGVILTPEGMEAQIATLAEHLAQGRFAGYSVAPAA